MREVVSNQMTDEGLEEIKKLKELSKKYKVQVVSYAGNEEVSE